MKTHLDLFSGIGGFALAAQWAGYRTVMFCEIDEWCQRVLRKNFPAVPVWGDVRTLDGRIIADAASAASKARSAVGVGARAQTEPLACYGIDLITAGYPCQPFSLAGKRLGAEDDRHLWPEVKRLLVELRPARFLGENVAGHINMGLDDVLSDLEEIGYAARPVVIPACAIDAPHRRDRVWIMADAGHAERGAGDAGGHDAHGQDTGRPQGHGRTGERGADVADTEGGVRFGASSGGTGHAAFGGEGGTDGLAADAASQGLEGATGRGIQRRVDGFAGGSGEQRAETQQRVGVQDDGLSRRLVDARWGGDPMKAFGPDWEDGVPRVVATEKDRVNRLKALGNSVVPQIPYLILKAMDGELDT